MSECRLEEGKACGEWRWLHHSGVVFRRRGPLQMLILIDCCSCWLLQTLLERHCSWFVTSLNQHRLLGSWES